VKTLRNDDLTQTETSLQWGFLKNIVNLDRLLVGGVSADQFDSDAGDCDDEAPQDAMPKIKASLKPGAVQPAKNVAIEGGEVQPTGEDPTIVKPGQPCIDDSPEVKAAEAALKGARDGEYRARMKARLARDAHDRESAVLSKLEADKGEAEHLERQRVVVQSAQEARK
jgi:hypothetical protein